ncbi:MAG TPA: hypothetical protein PLN48_09120 [Lachnospiraceae bacterium]|nr:hypothetical protein [Lachnospiraceae bacterium]
MKKIIPIILAFAAFLFAGIGAGYFISTNAGTVTENTDSEEAASASTATVFKRDDTDSGESISPANIDLFQQYIMALPTPTPTPSPIPAQIAPQEDFSPEAQAVIDHDGYLNVPNNSVVEYVETTKIKTKYFTVTIPGCWVGNIVIQCRYINDTASESSDTSGTDTVRDTMILTFYEKSNFKKYQASNSKSSLTDGELTEIRYASNKNDNTWLKTSNYEYYFANAALGNNAYDVFIYEPHDTNIFTTSQYAQRYNYLIGINYEGCLINTFKVNNGGTLTWADEYVEKAYVDEWDPNAEGIPQGSTIPDASQGSSAS